MAKKNFRERSSLFLIISFAVLTVASVILFISLQSDPIDEVLKTDQILKVLFVLYDEDEVITTDVLMYYPVTKSSAMFDIPGRTGAIWDTIGKVSPITEVYLEKGIKAYQKEVEKLLDTKIPFTIEISLSQFVQLTDLLGGLRVFIPSPIDVCSGKDTFLLPSGSVTLDGDKIYSYLRYRSEEDEYSDIQERNRNVILSLISNIHDEEKNISKKMFREYSKLMKYNIDKKYLLRLLTEISSIDSERLFPQTVTGSLNDVDGEILLFPYYDGQLIKDSCKQTMNALVSSNGISFSRTYVLEIQNGTPVQGLASRTASLFQSIGYNVMPTLNADRNDYEHTIIIDHINNKSVSSALGDFILCDNIIVEEVRSEEEGLEADTMVDFTIILGKDFDGRYVRQ